MSAHHPLDFIIGIDTERDCDPAWNGATPLSYSNVERGLEEKLAPILARHGARATLYLMSDVIEEDACARACARLSRDAGWELGTHLHPELVEPGRTMFALAGTRTSEFLTAHPAPVQRAKLETLTRLYHDRFGREPASFRAGRWAADDGTFEALISLGYRVDSSVTPGIRWVEGAQVVDWSRARAEPWVVRGLSGSIVEVPVTIRRDFLGRARWLRPGLSPARRMVSIVERIAAGDGDGVANMMFHSPELVPGASPGPQTDEELARMLSDIDVVLARARSLGFRFATMSEAADRIRGGSPAPTIGEHP